jgi:hypothetical protein
MNRIASTGPNSLTRMSTPFFIAASSARYRLGLTEYPPLRKNVPGIVVSTILRFISFIGARSEPYAGGHCQAVVSTVFPGPISTLKR